ncbi:MAG: histidine phosphatase family protein [Candidatus Krumholzibacteriia bacterium]
MRVFLARHGQTDWNAEHRLQGQSDTRLTGVGRSQALALAQLLANEPIDAIYASTLSRSLETARPLARAKGLEVRPRAAMVEMRFGILEGHRALDTDPQIRALWEARKRDPLNFRAPGAETYVAVQKRIAPFARELRRLHAQDTVLVVGHRGSNRVLLGLLLEWSLERTIRLKQTNDCVLEVRPGGDPELVQHRYTPVAQPGGNP